MSVTKLSVEGNNFINPDQGLVSEIPAGIENIANFFIVYPLGPLDRFVGYHNDWPACYL